jgi:hypothetical protein
MRGCIDVLNSNEMQWASCCGVSFGGCNAVYARFMPPFSSKKTFPANTEGGGGGRGGRE